MLPFGVMMKDDQVAAAVNYVRAHLKAVRPSSPG